MYAHNQKIYHYPHMYTDNQSIYHYLHIHNQSIYHYSDIDNLNIYHYLHILLITSTLIMFNIIHTKNLLVYVTSCFFLPSVRPACCRQHSSW